MERDALKRRSVAAAAATRRRDRERELKPNDKHAARLNSMRVILNALNYEGRDTSLDFVPDDQVGVSGSRALATTEADRIRARRLTD